VTAADASARGRQNRAKGATAERELAKWLRPYWPNARRAVVNGWTSKDASAADPGDLDGTSPDIWWSVKNTQVEAITAWFAEIEKKSGGRLGLLVQKRKGHASPGEWWCWLRMCDLADLLVGACADDAFSTVPVRMELQHLMPLLVSANYARPAA
jgi:hypothetical protein